MHVCLHQTHTCLPLECIATASTSMLAGGVKNVQTEKSLWIALTLSHSQTQQPAKL